MNTVPKSLGRAYTRRRWISMRGRTLDEVAIPATYGGGYTVTKTRAEASLLLATVSLNPYLALIEDYWRFYQGRWVKAAKPAKGWRTTSDGILELKPDEIKLLEIKDEALLRRIAWTV